MKSTQRLADSKCSGDHPGVGVILIHPPGDDRAGIAPGGHARKRRVRIADVRRHVGVAAVVGLRLADVGHPLGEEAGHVALENRGLREGLNVAHPAQSLRALGTVGGDAHHVSPLHPFHAMHDLVEQRVGTSDRARLRRGRVKHPADDGVLGRTTGQTGHLDVAKTVIGEMRFERGWAAAPRVLVDLCRAAQVGRIDRAVVVKHFGVTHVDLGSRRSGGRQPAPADHVLAHVEDVHARLRLGHFHRPQLLDHADRLVALGHQHRTFRCARMRQHLDRSPTGGAETGQVPAGLLLRGVVGFAEIDARPANRAVRGRLPRGIGHDGLRRTVGQFHVQSHQQAKLRSLQQFPVSLGQGGMHINGPVHQPPPNWAPTALRPWRTSAVTS